MDQSQALKHYQFANILVKKIYFIGLDNNHWNNIKVNHENEIFQVHRHFYDDDGVYRKILVLNQ